MAIKTIPLVRAGNGTLAELQAQVTAAGAALTFSRNDETSDQYRADLGQNVPANQPRWGEEIDLVSQFGDAEDMNAVLGFTPLANATGRMLKCGTTHDGRELIFIIEKRGDASPTRMVRISAFARTGNTWGPYGVTPVLERTAVGGFSSAVDIRGLAGTGSGPEERLAYDVGFAGPQVVGGLLVLRCSVRLRTASDWSTSREIANGVWAWHPHLNQQAYNDHVDGVWDARSNYEGRCDAVTLIPVTGDTGGTFALREIIT